MLFEERVLLQSLQQRAIAGEGTPMTPEEIALMKKLQSRYEADEMVAGCLAGCITVPLKILGCLLLIGFVVTYWWLAVPLLIIAIIYAIVHDR